VRRYLLDPTSGATRTVSKEAASVLTNGSWDVGYDIELLWYEELDHAQGFDLEKTRRPIIRAICAYSKTG
jgi:hypothetical protein